MRNIDNRPGIPSIWNVVTGSRAFSAIYHNLTGKPLIVSVLSQSAVVAVNQALSDSATPPTTLVDADSVPQTYYNKLAFTVLPGNYYQVISDDPAITLLNWVEGQ